MYIIPIIHHSEMKPWSEVFGSEASNMNSSGMLLTVSRVVNICGAFQKPLIKSRCSLSRFYFKKLWLLLSTYGHCTLCWGEFLRQDLRENDVIWQIFVHRHHFVCPRILVCPILRLHFILYPTAFTLLFWSQTSELLLFVSWAENWIHIRNFV